MTLDPRQWIRDADRVKANLQELADDRLVCKRECRIYIPVRFSERKLASIGVEIHILGIYAMVVDQKYYAVSNVNAMVRIEPALTNKVSFDEDEYYEFVFLPGTTVIANLQLIQSGNLVYSIYDEFFGKGRVPWYLGYEDLGHIFDTAKTHAGANIGTEHEVTELLVSMIARDPANRHRYYRQAVKSKEEVKQIPPAFIPLKSVVYSATNTVNKLAGSYFTDGLVSALNSPSERVERIEKILSL